jgi:uncharacterized protein YndB with AHSA1/START domain
MTAAPASKPFVISREFNAPRDLVYKLWTDREHLGKWFGPKGMTMEHKEFDFRPGGVVHYSMTLPDGKKMWGKWMIREIVPPSKLVWVNCFSDEQGGLGKHPFAPDWPAEMLTVVTFVEIAGKTKITIEWSTLNATPAEQKVFDSSHAGMNQGWGGTFEQFEAYLAGLKK